MRLRFGRTILLSVLGLVAQCAILPPDLEAPKQVENLSQLEAFLERIVRNGDPPGLSLVVTKSSGIVYSRGFGMADGPRAVPASAETLYQWWSITKPFTAVAIFQLAERGQLNLDDPVRQHLAFFDVEYPSAESRPVTIRHLLTHSSGLPDTGPEIIGWIHYEGDEHPNQTELIRRKLPDYSELEFEPGSESRYTNIGYMVLAAIIEQASGVSYPEYIRKNILTPLEMRSTGFTYSRERGPHEAAGSHPHDFMSYLVSHYIDMDRAVREYQNDRYWFARIYSDQQGATGLIGPPVDLARFARLFLQTDADFAAGGPILSNASLMEISRSIFPLSGSPDGSPEPRMGYGWFHGRRDGREFLSHAGAGAAFICLMRIYPREDLALIVMANSTYLGRDMGATVLDLAARLQW
jgi:CubicO group peptidase (beta-lactamase class C family)